MTDFDDMDVSGFTAEKIRCFDGITDPTLTDDLAALLPENRVRLALQPPRCWIAIPGVRGWWCQADTLDRAIEDALAQVP